MTIALCVSYESRVNAMFLYIHNIFMNFNEYSVHYSYMRNLVYREYSACVYLAKILFIITLFIVCFNTLQNIFCVLQ